MSDIPEIETLRQSEWFESEIGAYAVPRESAESAIRSALDRQAREIVEALRDNDRMLDATAASPSYQDGWVDAHIDAAAYVERHFCSKEGDPR